MRCGLKCDLNYIIIEIRLISFQKIEIPWNETQGENETRGELENYILNDSPIN